MLSAIQVGSTMRSSYSAIEPLGPLFQVSMRNLWQGNSIKEAIDYPRLHHQFLPNRVDVETQFPKV